MVIQLTVGYQIMHVNDGETFFRICLTPGPKTAGPAEGAKGTVEISGCFIN